MGVGQSGKEFGDAMGVGFDNFGQALANFDSDAAGKSLESILMTGEYLLDGLMGLQAF